MMQPSLSECFSRQCELVGRDRDRRGREGNPKGQYHVPASTSTLRYSSTNEADLFITKSLKNLSSSNPRYFTRPVLHDSIAVGLRSTALAEKLY
jgi:hypothetical protein